MRTINDRTPLAFTSVFTDDGKFAPPAVHDHQFIVGIFNHIDVDEFDFSLNCSCTNIRLLNAPAGRTADVECPHGQLGSGFTDGLGGKDSHGLSHLNRSTMGQIPAVALGTDAMFGAAGQCRADQDSGNAAFSIRLNRIVFIDFLART
jgi:hypothetical protein